MMSEKVYLELKRVTKDRSNLMDVAAQYSVPYQVIRSIYALNMQEKASLEHAFHRERAALYFQEFKQTLKDQLETSTYKSTVLLDLSEKYDTQPWLMAIFVFRGLCQSLNQNSNVPLLEWKKDHSLLNVKDAKIDEAHWEAEIQNCILFDDTSGELADHIKHHIGLEYEITLAQRLLSIGARFLDDTVQRAIHLSKTPDALLIGPVIVCGTPVNWVESKALFGDPANLTKHFTTQLVPYRDRYGPGLVIYWFGFVVEAAAALSEGKGILVLDQFPDDAFVL